MSYSPKRSRSRSPARESRERRRSRSRSRSRSPRKDDRRSRSRSPRGGGGGGTKMKGVACRWNERGFGFIKPNDGAEDVFCHFSAIKDGNALRDGDEVEFFSVWDERKGKNRAEEVTGGCEEDRGRPPARGGSFGGGGRGGGEVEMCGDYKNGRCFRDRCRFSHGGQGAYDSRDDRGGGGGGGGSRDRYDDRGGGGGGGSRDRYDDRDGGRGGGRDRSPAYRRGSPRY